MQPVLTFANIARPSPRLVSLFLDRVRFPFFNGCISVNSTKRKVNGAVAKNHMTEPLQEIWGPFLESPGNFSGPKSNIQIEILRKRAGFLASKLLHFVSLTDSFITLDAKLLEPRSLM